MPSASFPPRVASVIPADDARDPDRWLAAASWLVVIYGLAQILLFGFGRDHAAHALVGETVLGGGAPYRDAWDASAPGIFLLHAATQALLGKSMLALRLVEVGGLLTLVLCFRWLGGVLFGSKAAGLLGGALAVLLHAQLEFWHTGQPESFAGFLTAGALLVTVRSTKRVLLQAAIVGGLSGCVLLLDPLLTAFVAVCGAYLVRRLQMTRGPRAALAPLLLLGAGLALPALVCGGWLLAVGALGDLSWTWTSVVTRQAEAAWAGRSAPELFYTVSVEALVGFSALLAFGVLAAIAMPSGFAREREGLSLLFGMVCVQLAAIAFEGDFVAHDFGATLPLLGLIAGVGWYKSWRRLLPNGAPGILAFASVLLLAGAMRDGPQDVPEGFWKRSALRTAYLLRLGSLSTREDLDRLLATQGNYQLGSIRRVAYELERRAAPTDSVYVAADEPMVYWLSSARPASRFLRGDPRPDPEEAPGWSPQLQTDLERQRPAYVVVREHDDPRAALPHPWFERHYRKRASVEDFALYEREEDEPRLDAP